MSQLSAFVKRDVGRLLRLLVLTASLGICFYAQSAGAGEPLVLTIQQDQNDATTISDLAFSPDGRLLAAACGRYTGGLQEPTAGLTVVWSAESGEELARLRSHEDGVSSVLFTPDGKRIVTAGFDGTLIIWDSGAYEAKKLVLKADKRAFAITALACSSDGNLLAVAVWGSEGAETNEIRLIELTSGNEVGRLSGHTDGVLSLDFTLRSDVLVSSSMDQTIRIWSVAQRRLVKKLSTDGSWAYDVDCSPGGSQFAIARGSLKYKGGGDVALWDFEKSEETIVLKQKTDAMERVEFSPDSRWLATSSRPGVGTLVDLSNQNKPRKIPGIVYRWAFTSDGQSIAGASGDDITIWKLADLVSEPQ